MSPIITHIILYRRKPTLLYLSVDCPVVPNI
jgi:hypothetical protein